MAAVLCRRAARGALVAALPLFLKWDSYGEFVFDFGWAEAYQRAGIDYYPKLVAAAPLTPVQGRRILGDPAEVANSLVLCSQRRALGREIGASGLHVLFAEPDEVEQLSRRLSPAARLSVSLAESRLRNVRRLPRRPSLVEAQASAEGEAPARRDRHRSRRRRGRCRAHGGDVALLPRHERAEVGPGLSQSGSFWSSASAFGTGWCSCSRATARAGSGARSTR